MRRLTILIATALAVAPPALAQERTGVAETAESRGSAPRSTKASSTKASSTPSSGTTSKRSRTARRPRPASLKLEPATRRPAPIGRAGRVQSVPLHTANDLSAPTGSDRPAWRVLGSIPLAWRSATVRPDAGLGLRFRTDTPYVGLDLEGQVYPYRAFHSKSLPRWAEPLGLSLTLSQRVLHSRVGPEELGSREQRAAIDVLYDLPVRTRTRLTGRAGWGVHRFAVDDSDVIRTATHRGLRIGLDAAHPIHPLVEAIAGVTLMPWSGVSGPDADARGDSTDGWGTQFLLGAAGPIRRVEGLGWRVGYEYLRFSDEYTGAGPLSSGGSGSSSHHAILFGVTFQR